MPVIPQAKTENVIPETLKPYDFHGLDLNIHGKEALAECPFCNYDKGPKFSVNVETGQWRCLVCGGGLDKGGGGPIDFIRLLWEASYKATPGEAYRFLAEEKRIDQVDTLIHWGLAQSVVDSTWLVPGWGYDYQGKEEFSQLYRYQQVGQRKALMPTPGRKHVLIGQQLVDSNSSDIHVCEGIWDALHWWEALRTAKIDKEGNLSSTAAVEQSMAQGISVVAAATCSSFPPNATKLFKGKTATFLYDNDHPGKNKASGEPLIPAGFAGMKRDTAKIASVAHEVQYLKWGEEGYDPKLPSGYDLSDALLEGKHHGIVLVYHRIEEAPIEWRVATSVSGGEIGPKPCSSWKELINYWRKAMKWTPGLEHALASGLASIVSTNSVGDQLWLKIIGPASCGKTTIVEAFTVNKKHVIAKSSIRGFHSGFKSDGDSTEDNGLIPQIKNRTLVTKDGDTLLQAPNLNQILSEARDLYDGSSRTHYRNKMSRDYDGIRMTWLLCGTASLRQLDSSELGERFLDCVIMHKIDEDLEDEILWRKVHQIDGQVGVEAGTEGASHYSPELLEAMERTAGYIDWLKDNAATMLQAVVFDNDAKQSCVDIGKFVAYMRARPSDKQSENAERELAVRLVSQHARYAKCLAFVLNKTSVETEVVRRTRQIGLDTARGIVLGMTRTLYECGPEGSEFKALNTRLHIEEGKLRTLLRFLIEIGALQRLPGKTRVAYSLSRRMKSLYERIMRPVEMWQFEEDYEAL